MANMTEFLIGFEVTKIMEEGDFFKRIMIADNEENETGKKEIVDESIEKITGFFNELYLDTPEAQEAKATMIVEFRKYQYEYFGVAV